MTVLIDSGVFYAHADEDATRHSVARDAFDTVIDGELGQPYASDYIYDEAVTLTLSRTGEYAYAQQVGQRIRGTSDYPELVGLERVTPAVFDAAVAVFERYDDQHLSFTDATSIALVEERDIDGILSFDDDFDGVTKRFDPADIS